MTIITVDSTAIDDERKMEAALDDGVVTIVTTLANSAHRRGRRVAVDMRSDIRADPLGAQEAILQAVRGLVQAYVSEAAASIPPVNVVVSTHAQTADRELTWAFLDDDNGTMARGATFDLREEVQ